MNFFNFFSTKYDKACKKVQSQRFALQELLLQFLLMYHYCTSSFLFRKKVQSQRFALQELLLQFLLMYHYCTSSFLFRKKVQSQRFALQELLLQFLLMYHYCTSSFLFRKKVQSQRFALQELLLQFLLMYHYCTSSFLFRKKVQSQRFALQELLLQFLLMYHYCTSIFLFHKKCKASALHSKNCYCNSCWSTTTARAFSYSTKNAKPALCTPRIAIAILVDVPLLHEHFPIPQKMQSQRFALQELLLQFLLVCHYCTNNFLFHKKGALQPLFSLSSLTNL